MIDIQKLLNVMASLRDPRSGCPWDIEQDFRSIAPYTIEEAYEVADAIDRGDLPGLRDELGDLLLQVVFHARMAEEIGAFTFADVVQAITDKLVRRHPHVFGNERIESASAQSAAWESFKAEERSRNPQGNGVLAGVAAKLPALARAAKLGRRAAGVGFDWQDVAGVAVKVREELAEFEAVVATDPVQAEQELGDLLFTVANLARHADIDPEESLRLANAKFERRFAEVERQVVESGRDWRSFSAAELDHFWENAKRAR